MIIIGTDKIIFYYTQCSRIVIPLLNIDLFIWLSGGRCPLVVWLDGDQICISTACLIRMRYRLEVLLIILVSGKFNGSRCISMQSPYISRLKFHSIVIIWFNVVVFGRENANNRIK